MNNIYSIHEQRQAKQNSAVDEDNRLSDACVWISKLDRNFSKEEQQAFEEWVCCNPKNFEVLLEVAHLWDKMNELNRLTDLFPETPSIKKNRRSKMWAGALVASITLFLSAGLYVNFNEARLLEQEKSLAAINLETTLSTSIGESNTVNLPDGSKIVLNTNTLAEIKFSSSDRIIELKQGEIHIDVAHDKSRPLSVIVGGKIVQAIGTAFNIEVRNDSFELIVTDGKVLVAPVEAKQLLTESFALPKSSVAVSKGEKVNLALLKIDKPESIEEKVIKVAPIEIAASLSWRTGNLIFRGEPLVEAMAEIGRYSDVEFELDGDASLKQIRVAGMFKTGDIAGLLDVLKHNFNINHERISETRIVLRFDESI